MTICRADRNHGSACSGCRARRLLIFVRHERRTTPRARVSRRSAGQVLPFVPTRWTAGEHRTKSRRSSLWRSDPRSARRPCRVLGSCGKYWALRTKSPRGRTSSRLRRMGRLGPMSRWWSSSIREVGVAWYARAQIESRADPRRQRRTRTRPFLFRISATSETRTEKNFFHAQSARRARGFVRRAARRTPTDLLIPTSTSHRAGPTTRAQAHGGTRTSRNATRPNPTRHLPKRRYFASRVTTRRPTRRSADVADVWKKRKKKLFPSLTHDVFISCVRRALRAIRTHNRRNAA